VPIRGADRVPANAYVVTDRGPHQNLPLGGYSNKPSWPRSADGARGGVYLLVGWAIRATPNRALRSVNEPPEDAAFPGVKPAAASVRAPSSYLPRTDLCVPDRPFLIRPRIRASPESCTPDGR
jgi:hypothetical protein